MATPLWLEYDCLLCWLLAPSRPQMLPMERQFCFPPQLLTTAPCCPVTTRTIPARPYKSQDPGRVGVFTLTYMAPLLYHICSDSNIPPLFLFFCFPLRFLAHTPFPLPLGTGSFVTYISVLCNPSTCNVLLKDITSFAAL